MDCTAGRDNRGCASRMAPCGQALLVRVGCVQGFESLELRVSGCFEVQRHARPAIGCAKAPRLPIYAGERHRATALPIGQSESTSVEETGVQRSSCGS